MTPEKADKRGKKSFLTTNPFEEYSEKQQYFLGLLASDGSISKDGKVKLKLKDRELVDEFSEFLGGMYKVREESTKTGVMYRVSFGNREVVNYLKSVGITNKKSFTFCPNLEPTSHFVRGYFDGDGHVSQSGRVKITTASSKMIRWLISLYKKLRIHYSVLRKGSCFDIYILAKSREAFFNYLYRDSSLYLNRKYKIYCGLLEKSSKKTPNMLGKPEEAYQQG